MFSHWLLSGRLIDFPLPTLASISWTCLPTRSEFCTNSLFSLDVDLLFADLWQAAHLPAEGYPGVLRGLWVRLSDPRRWSSSEWSSDRTWASWSQGAWWRKKRTHLYKKKKKNPVFWLLPFENCSTWLFRKSEVTYVLNIVSNNKSTHTVKRWT